MDFGMLREALRRGVDFLDELRTQAGNLGLIPERGFHRVLAKRTAKHVQ